MTHWHARGQPRSPGPSALHRLPAARGTGGNVASGRDCRGDCHCRPAGGPPMSPTVGLYNYLVVGAILFALGMVGFLARRNLIIMFLAAEMMLQGVALNL